MQGAPSPHPGLSFGAFVATIAIIQTIVALAIDMMVPALGAIAASFHLGEGNQRQWVIAVFVIAFGASQLGYGLVADRFGRRKLLLGCLSLYTLCAFASTLAGSFLSLIHI